MRQQLIANQANNVLRDVNWWPPSLLSCPSASNATAASTASANQNQIVFNLLLPGLDLQQFQVSCSCCLHLTLQDLCGLAVDGNFHVTVMTCLYFDYYFPEYVPHEVQEEEVEEIIAKVLKQTQSEAHELGL